jgi:hypothetical protein
MAHNLSRLGLLQSAFVKGKHPPDRQQGAIKLRGSRTEDARTSEMKHPFSNAFETFHLCSYLLWAAPKY